MSVFIPILKKDSVEECSNHHTVFLVSCAGQVMLKILQARFQQYVNRELPGIQARFQKGKGTRNQISTFVGSWKMQGISRKTSASLIMLKLLTV